MTERPEALRLADAIDYPDVSFGIKAAAELRRLHAENEALRAGEAFHKVAVQQRDSAWREVEALRADAERWQSLYRKAVNVANGLTNYIEDRPELRQAERQLDAIQNAARSKTE